MKLTMTITLGDIEVDTDSETGRLDAFWVNGKNFADKTIEELVIEIVSEPGWAKMISNAMCDRQNEYKGPDRMEDDDCGHPV